MSDWRKVYSFQKNSFVENFPSTSFLLAGVTFYQETIKNLNIGDKLEMSFESDNHETSAIIIKNISNICGYVPKDIKEKIKPFVPSKVKVIDKRYFNKNNSYSLRVDII